MDPISTSVVSRVKGEILEEGEMGSVLLSSGGGVGEGG